MTSQGMRGVTNPSEILLTQHDEPLSGIAIAAAIEGPRPMMIEAQALATQAVYGVPCNVPPMALISEDCNCCWPY